MSKGATRAGESKRNAATYVTSAQRGAEVYTRKRGGVYYCNWKGTGHEAKPVFLLTATHTSHTHRHRHACTRVPAVSSRLGGKPPAVRARVSFRTSVLHLCDFFIKKTCSARCPKVAGSPWAASCHQLPSSGQLRH